MILINIVFCICEVIDNFVLIVRIDDLFFDLKIFFMYFEFYVLFEIVGENGEFIDIINGCIINFGYCIEMVWFIFEEFRYCGWDKEMFEIVLIILDWFWEWGWDKDFGGIINFCDCRNFFVQDYLQDMKFWWLQMEVIIVILYVYEVIGDEKYLKMYNQVSDWIYVYFLDWEYGEWYGYLYCDGSVVQFVKGNIFKGFFYIFRMMIKGYVLCNEILFGLFGMENIKL